MFLATVGLVFVLGFYMLPSMVAAGRHHRSGTAIAVLNLLLGWTLLGWVAALVWAFVGTPVTAPGKAEARVHCPQCRELIISGARKCKHCGSALDGPAALPAGMRACPDCHRTAPMTDKYCPTCGHNMRAA